MSPEAGLLFSESATRWLVEIEPEQLPKIKKIFSHLPIAVIGQVDKAPALDVKSRQQIFKLAVPEMKKLWNAFSEAQ